jgi:hypothetical protein
MSVEPSSKSALYRHGDVLVAAISEIPAGAMKQTHFVRKVK